MNLFIYHSLIIVHDFFLEHAGEADFFFQFSHFFYKKIMFRALDEVFPFLDPLAQRHSIWRRVNTARRHRPWRQDLGRASEVLRCQGGWDLGAMACGAKQCYLGTMCYGAEQEGSKTLLNRPGIKCDFFFEKRLKCKKKIGCVSFR
jgi:hypothetical protein